MPRDRTPIDDAHIAELKLRLQSICDDLHKEGRHSLGDRVFNCLVVLTALEDEPENKS